MLCCWVEDPHSEAFKLHLPRVFDYLWIAEDGMKMQVKTKKHYPLLDYLYESPSTSYPSSSFLFLFFPRKDGFLSVCVTDEWTIELDTYIL